MAKDIISMKISNIEEDSIWVIGKVLEHSWYVHSFKYDFHGPARFFSYRQMKITSLKVSQRITKDLKGYVPMKTALSKVFSIKMRLENLGNINLIMVILMTVTGRTDYSQVMVFIHGSDLVTRLLTISSQITERTNFITDT